MTDEKLQLLESLDLSRSRLNDIIERFNAGWQIYPAWKVKETVDHIAGWDESIIEALRSHARGDVPAVTAPHGINAYNAESVAGRGSLPYERSIQEFHAARETLKQAILALPDQKYAEPLVLPWGATGTIASVMQIFIHHEQEHAEDLAAILNSHDG